MNMIKKSMFPAEIFDDLDKKDTIIALIFILIYIIVDFVILYLVKFSSLFYLMKNDKNRSYRLLFGLITDMPAFLAVFLILKCRKQYISTVGIRKKGLKSSILVGIIFLLLTRLQFIKNTGISIIFMNKTLFYIFFVGFYEELICRGFLWPRLVVGLGRIWGTVISGLFFGMGHVPIDIVFNNKTFFDIVILGNTSNTNMGGGLLGALFFIYIYTRNDNILLPSFIHGILDLK
ncbi:CPBP family intramembrane glutamic endopeptidase [Clostridium neuense]|uniref:CPBP family intramembrane glutamic endopeptidase n=1 Tax=Clostridium neuense TaxID=1728934 RepID=A0ABW8TDU2_9CLOT